MIPRFETPWLMITGGDIVLPGGGVMESGTLMINQGIIQEISDKAPASMLLGDEEVVFIDATNHWITPGLIDQHFHGAFGVDFNQSKVDALQKLLRTLPQYGITGILPTVMTAPKLDMLTSLANLEEAIQTQEANQTRMFGIHLEGPFLSPEFRGAHPPEDLKLPTMENLEGLLSPSLKRITLAPELDPEMQMIHFLSQNQGVLCSIGHSGAESDITHKAIEAGANCATHLFNAMKRIEHRHPGITVTCLLEDDVFIELITDGKHLDPDMLHLVFRVKPFEKTIIISDCNALTGMPPGYSMCFGKQTITLHPEGALNEEGKLAGSTMLITDCVRNLVQWNLLTFPDAIQLATAHPANYLGESPLFGQIAPNAMADLVLWNKSDLSIHEVYLAGEPVIHTQVKASL